ncbi:MAG: phosphohydrolase [Bacilli bacterium]|nr:phosphohydrolase [Bacilli bacterium]MDD4719011.1 phosphohydrolase [Bacilli bacterium]
MNINNDDNEFIYIIGHILKNKEFNSLKNIEHHGVNRYDHSVKVSYYSYKISKFLKLDYHKTAKAGLLHDFFLSDEDRTAKERFISTFVHPNKAVENSIEHFDVSEKEINIIQGHMFPLNYHVPKYAESWVVNIVDKSVSLKELSKKFGYKLSYSTNLFILFLINYIR